MLSIPHIQSQGGIMSDLHDGHDDKLPQGTDLRTVDDC